MPCRTTCQQIDEDPVSEELVDLFFARGVTLHEPFHGARLVAAVVEDMHARIVAAPLDDEVDEALERNPLAGPGRVPQMGR